MPCKSSDTRSSTRRRTFTTDRKPTSSVSLPLSRSQKRKHKRNKRVRVSIGAPWKRRSMLAMSQLGHYVNRRNVQAAVSQVWPIFSVGGENKRCRRAGVGAKGDARNLHRGKG